MSRRSVPSTATSLREFVIRAVSSAARIAWVSGQRRYTVGRLTPARRAISASVTRSTPKAITQSAAASMIRASRGSRASSLLIDIMCNTVTHDRDT